MVEQYGEDYEPGTWNLEWRKKSSNCREVENLTDWLEPLVVEGLLQNHKVFLITNNSEFKGAYYKGHLHSRELSDIVFRVHKAQQVVGFVLHVTHISRKRMMVSGVGGLSRGDLTKGMTAGHDPLLFIPFNKETDAQIGEWRLPKSRPSSTRAWPGTNNAPSIKSL